MPEWQSEQGADDLRRQGEASRSTLQSIKHLVQELIAINKYNIAAKVMKTYSIAKEKYPVVVKELMKGAACGMARWENKFDWQTLEEIFEDEPEAIAAYISSKMRGRAQVKN